MLAHAAAVTREVMAQREEILRAFVAKHGFDPDECEQVYENNPNGTRWYVIRLAPDRVRMMQREVILSRLKQKQFTRWQEFCLRLGGILK